MQLDVLPVGDVGGVAAEIGADPPDGAQLLGADGTAVNASEKLWTVSASNATEPETITTRTCSSAVTPRIARLILTARTPNWLASSASSMEWSCSAAASVSAMSCWRVRDQA